MTVPLDDDRWCYLETAYHQPCDELLAWLRSAYQGNLDRALLSEIINEIQHQGDSSTSMYAVAPHLLDLADICDRELSQQLIIHSGLIYAAATAPNAVPCPDSVARDFESSSKRGLEMASNLLLDRSDIAWFKYLLAAIAGFAGHGRLGRLLEGLEF